MHWFAIGSKLGGGVDFWAFGGFILFVCPFIWLILRFILNRLGSYLSGKTDEASRIIFWRDNFGELGAAVGVLLSIIVALFGACH